MGDREPAVAAGQGVETMSFGKMTSTIQLIRTVKTTDSEGFPTTTDTVLATVHAYREQKNMSEKWRNSAVFQEATTLFRFRNVPNVTVDTTLVIVSDSVRYDIISVEDVRNRGMYYEVLAKSTEASNG